MDVPEFTDELVDLIAGQSDAQSGHHSIRELERIRDDNLVTMMRGLKARNWGAGKLLNAIDQSLAQDGSGNETALIRTVERVVPIDWTDYNNHMNEARYGQIFSDAADALMIHIGAGADYIAAGLSYFTVETTVKYLEECAAGDSVYVDTQVLIGEGKKLKLFHKMYLADGRLSATGEQFLLHVDLTTRKSCAPRHDVATNLASLAAVHAALPNPLEAAS